MSLKSYTLKRADRCAGGKEKATVGETVYKTNRYDYGLANDDTRFTGIEHVSVTRDPSGDYPFFTVPIEDLAP